MGEREMNAITETESDDLDVMVLPDGTRLTDERAAAIGQQMIDAGLRHREQGAEGGTRTHTPLGTGT